MKCHRCPANNGPSAGRRPSVWCPIGMAWGHLGAMGTIYLKNIFSWTDSKYQNLGKSSVDFWEWIRKIGARDIVADTLLYQYAQYIVNTSEWWLSGYDHWTLIYLLEFVFDSWVWFVSCWVFELLTLDMKDTLIWLLMAFLDDPCEQQTQI